MKNLDKHEWEFNGEKYAVRWLEGHGYDVAIEKRFATVTYIKATKDLVSLQLNLPLGNPKINYRKIMEQFDRDFALQSEILKLLQKE